MISFALLFPELAHQETRVLQTTTRPGLPQGAFALRESYCSERGCDCRRVLINVVWLERDMHVATINYAFEPPPPPYEDEGQVFLDPLNPQSGYSGPLLALFEEMIADDAAYRERLIAHYTAWKRVVDDPAHPDQSKLLRMRREGGREPARREAPKPLSGGAACPCGSGRKYRKCCKKSALRQSPG
ncbi:MAG: YecA family protein [Candidatus Sericytochromatia bacterium]